MTEPCIAFALQAAAQHHGIPLIPDPTTRPEVVAAVFAGTDVDLFPGWDRVSEPANGDLVLMRGKFSKEEHAGFVRDGHVEHFTFGVEQKVPLARVRSRIIAVWRRRPCAT